MKTRIFCLSLLVTASAAFAGARDALWKQVDDAISRGLPQTAITNLQPIIDGAMKDKAYGEAAKAIARKIVLEGNIQGNKPEEKITRIEAEIAKAPAELKPLLETILADWYWHYFQQNRWRFLQRTQTGEAPGKDFTTWDLPRLYAEIDKHFQQALSAEKFLKSTPVNAWDDLLQRFGMPDAYRPTLYDFIAHEALQFYTSGEQAGAKPEDAYELSADGPALDESAKFLEWHATFATKQFPDSPIVKALNLFGQLMAFHKADTDPTAFLDVDLERLAYAWNTAVGENKPARYKAALKAFADKNADNEVSAMALWHWAQVVREEGDWVEARVLAQRGENAHRSSPGGKLCHNLIADIEGKSINLGIERVWNLPLPKIDVRYRNVTNIYFRAVAWDWNDFLNRSRSRPEYLNQQERQELMSKPVALEWSAPLPPTADFKERTEDLPAPDTLKKGHYFLLASHDPKFGEEDNQVTFSDFWVSDLALVVRPREGNIEGFVLNAFSGEPLRGAEVQGWYLDNNGNRVAVPKVDTDELGFFSLRPGGERYRGHLLRARYEGDELGSQQEFMVYDRNKPLPDSQTVFFTDRALYRPGQTIQYKGICLRVDQDRNDYQLLPGQTVTVVFSDPNGKEIAYQEQRANAYGSFGGSFTAPAGRVTGQHTIIVTSRAPGSAHFNVEEYKRPKFQVTLDAPKTAPKLNDQVSLQGKAEAYTGAAIDGALVKWRIVREIRFPWWCWWGWRDLRSNASQEIAHGDARTQTDGTFKIEFTAKPDASVSPTNEPTFHFTIYADVTDTTGETRSSSRGVVVGYTALQVSLTADDWQTEDKAVEIALKSTTLDGEAQKAEGALKVYRLAGPEQVVRPPLPGMQPVRRTAPRAAQPVAPRSRGVAPRAGVASGRGGSAPGADGDVDWSNPDTWPQGDLVAEKGWTSDAEGKAAVEFKLGEGLYRAMLETQDRFGKKVTARLGLRVLKPDATKLAAKLPNLVAAPKWTLEPGEDFIAVWGTGYDEGRAFIEIEHRQKMIQRFWTQPGQTQQQIKQAVSEAMRGGFQVHVTQVRENRAYLTSRRVDVPWSNKELDLKWEHFISKLEPGQKETWSLVIQSPKSEVRAAEKSAAEMVAALYDESLDQYLRHGWPARFGIFYQDYPGGWSTTFENSAKSLQWLKGNWLTRAVAVDVRYREFPYDLVANWWGYQMVTRGIGGARGGRGGRGGMGGGEMMLDLVAGESAQNMPVAAAMAAPANLAPASARAEAVSGAFDAVAKAVGGAPAEKPGAGASPVDLSQVTARKNLNETAFFYPQLTSDSNGIVRISFTMPEALTTWHFLGFAHDQSLRSGFLEGHAVTAKELMVQPNPPRYLREGDEIEFTVKVSNQSAARQQGKVRLTFNYALNDQSADKDLNIQVVGQASSPAGSGGVSPPERRAGGLPNLQTGGLPHNEFGFDIPSKESRSFSWRVKVPDGCGFLTYKTVGSTGRISDGEEGYLPVLSRRIFVTESLPLPIRGKVGGGEVIKKFEFTKLLKSGSSKTLQNEGLTVQMVSQPAWYAVMALPYLMEYPYECTEQTFNRLYANALARSIASSDPKIRRIFDQWKGTPALDSPLEKNQDLKMVALEETPWYRQAQNESQARKNVGVLFDENRLNSETENTLRKLSEMQLGDGSWPWFPGGLGNDYITLYITTGFGRLRHLNVDIPVDAALRSLNRLDNWMREHYERILQLPNPDDYVLSPTDAFYLYGRSFFLKDRPVAAPNQAAVDFFLKQGRKLWLKVNDRQSQGHLALALHRWGGDENRAVAADIMKSIKERSVVSEEMGRFWRETEMSWWWYRAPIETQALMIEAFDEIMGDQQAVEDCRVWLLKQKQTQDWKTTKATADAIYGLLLRGRNLLSSDKLVEVTLGGVNVTPKAGPVIEGRPQATSQPEAGTGFYERRFSGAEVKPRMGEITVTKMDEGVSWGSVHWQYLEDMTKVTPYEGTPLKLKKTLYTKVNTAKGPTLEPVKGPLAVGDELVVRIELRVDRDMEYIHLKDQRGSGTEPVNVISRYKYQDGLRYYESTRDTASHFFIDYLPKGTYVFEYSTRVQLRGQYQTGIAEIQCMYAPEFNSHSESFNLVVK